MTEHENETNNNIDTKISPRPELTFVVKNWEELSRDELYYLLKLRADVFVVEQNCVYPDIDDKDKKAIHVMGYITYQDKQQLVVYSRVFPQGTYFEQYACVGRVVSATAWRRYGYGHELLDKALNVLIQNFTLPCIISAQKYLFNFYSSHGFKRTEKEEYLEDGIPHVEMLLVQSDLTGINQQYRDNIIIANND